MVARPRSSLRWFGLSVALIAAGCTGPIGRALFVPPTPLTPADAVVVLSNRPPVTAGGEIAPETERRMRRGVSVFQRGLARIFIVTGNAREAAVMRAFALALGIPESMILVDGESRDTADNARNAVNAYCGGSANCAPDFIVVSSPYHLRRAARLFRCAGAHVQLAATDVPDDGGYQVSFAASEYAIRLGYLFYDACARAQR